MKRLLCVLITVLFLTGCSETDFIEDSSMNSDKEEWLSTLDAVEKLYYQYDYANYDGLFRVTFSGRVRGNNLKFVIETRKLPDFDEEDYIEVYYTTSNKYEYYVDFSNIDCEYELNTNLSDDWYAYVGENGLCTSSSN